MKTTFVAMILGLAAAPLAAQVTKEDIKKLTVAGVSEEVILNFVKANGPTPPMSADDLADLKLSGAGEQVLAILAQGTLGSPNANSEATPAHEEAVLPETSYVDYASSDYTPVYSYYGAVPFDSCGPSSFFYYSPWFHYYYPSCSVAAPCLGSGCLNSFSFGFPCYNACFYPWYDSCFASFGWGCRSLGCCYRPFGFCHRPFGSFFSSSQVALSARSPRFSSFFAATGPTVGAFRSTVSFQNQPFRNSFGTTGALGRGLPSPEARPLPRPAIAPRVVESRGWPSSPGHSFSGRNSRAFSAPRVSSNWHSPAPFSHGSSFSGSWSHNGGGQSHGGSWGGGHGGSHGGGGHR